MTTAGSYATSRLLNWTLAAVFVMGSVIGSLTGARAAIRLSQRRGLLTTVFAAIIAAIALYMLSQSLAAWS